MYWIAGIIIFVVLFYWWMSRPLIHKNLGFTDISSFIGSLEKTAADGGLLFFTHKHSKRFIQFAIYREPQKPPVIHFGYPNTEWSKEFFNKVKSELETAGFNVRITDTGEVSVSQILEVDIEVQSNEDIYKCSELAQITLKSMGFSESDKFNAHYKTDIDREYAKGVYKQVATLNSGIFSKWAARKVRAMGSNLE